MRKINYTFGLFPDTKKLLEKISKHLGLSQQEMSNRLIKEKANRLNLGIDK